MPAKVICIAIKIVTILSILRNVVGKAARMTEGKQWE